MAIRQKIQEISLALIKVSVAARRNEFRQKLEHLSFALLEVFGERDYEKVLAELEKIEIFASFGKLIYEIEPINAKILIEECGNAANSIRQSSGFEGKTDISSLFSRNDTLDSLKKNDSNNEKESLDPLKGQKRLSLKVSKKNNAVPLRGISRSETIDDNAAIPNAAIEKNNPAMNPAIPTEIKNNAVPLRGISRSETIEQGDSAIRQSAIVDKIRQSGNQETQLKDIIAGFNDVSERTIRYDLQKLCNQGILERIGSGGPSTYYKIRQI